MLKAKLPEDVRDAISALQPDRNFRKVIGWFAQGLEDARVQNDDLSGDELTRNQGCAKTLAKILKSIDEVD